jgi:murein DD-endopeptidase / murein LD-carboxypeptidase
MRNQPQPGATRGLAAGTCVAVATAALLTSGCRLSHSDSSTGLPYFPPAGADQFMSGANAQDGIFMQGGSGKAIQPSAWRTAAGGWIGVPHVEGGHSRSGIDCSGFTDEMYLEVAGHGLARTSVGQYMEGRPIDLSKARPGDLVFFTTTSEKISHVGLWLGDGQFAHASSQAGVKISSISEPYWYARFVGARRMPQ